MLDRGPVKAIFVPMPDSPVSISPSGERFALPKPEQDRSELPRLETIAGEARAAGREVVVVLGVGFWARSCPRW